MEFPRPQVPAILVLLICAFFSTAAAQENRQSYALRGVTEIDATNETGRIRVVTSGEEGQAGNLLAVSAAPFARSDVSVETRKGRVEIKVSSPGRARRIDLEIVLPERSSVTLRTLDGEIGFSGNFKEVKAETASGTIVADVPLTNLKYKFLWTTARPRFVSDAVLAEPEEKNAGKTVIEGELKESPEGDTIDVEVRTGRGILLLNVNPSEVPSSLVERPLTEAAKAIIRSGDLLLSEAIRRAAPKYFGEYAATLPPRRTGPELVAAPERQEPVGGGLKRINVQVTDPNNRAVAGLKKEDFALFEDGLEKEIVSVETSTAPFNLVLLLDVSGSVENYVDFIRKAARSFVDTVDRNDRVAIITFNDDVKALSAFSKDRGALSDSLDTFDAGGGTAFYDALAYVLSDTLEPLKGERTAIVALTDGEDNRSFLSFDTLVGSLQESGALVYPLYVPAGVIAGSTATDESASLGAADPLRDRYLSLSLTDKAKDEGEELAKVSGGVFYPISRVSELQRAYDDIVAQLRTAYTLTYRSSSRSGRAEVPRLRVKVGREGTFVRIAQRD